jgi:glutathione S-transferase
MRVLWGIGTPRTLRPLWALEELGLEYTHKKILPRGSGMEDPHFRSLSMRHKVPFFVDGQVKIGESAAIINYLAAQYGCDDLCLPAPGSPRGAALLDYTMFVMTEIDARLYTCRLHGEPPMGLSCVYGAAPAAVETAGEYTQRSLREAARWFVDGREYVLGERFGTADILLVSCLDWALQYKLELPAPLGAYRNRLALRPAYVSAKALNDPSEAEL